MQMESERNQLWSAKQNLESERLGLRDELVRAEQEKMEVDNEKHGVLQVLEMTGMSRIRFEEELQVVSQQRADVQDKLNVTQHEKTAISHELLSARKEVEKHAYGGSFTTSRARACARACARAFVRACARLYVLP